MDDNARKIFDEALATLDRTAGVEVVRRDDAEDALTEWRRGMRRAQPKPQQRQRSLTDAEAERLRNEMRAYVDDKLEARNEVWKELLAQALAAERRRWTREIGALELRVDALMHEATKRAADADGVVELPQFIRRIHDNAA